MLKYSLRGFLGDKQRETLFFFLDVITTILEEVHSSSRLDELQVQVDTALALMERDFPITVQVSTHW